MSDLLNAGTAQEQLAKCDAVKPEERKLWESQDVVTGALPHALSEAFQTVEHDFLQTNKVGHWSHQALFQRMNCGLTGRRAS